MDAGGTGTGVRRSLRAHTLKGHDGDVVTLYRREMDRIAESGATPILFQTSRLHESAARDKAAAYREICRGFPAVLAFELSPVFAPNGEIFDDETFRD